MDISVIDEDGNENEYSISLCCATCLGCDQAQFSKILSRLSASEVLKIPNSIFTENQFIEYMKSI